MAAFAFITIRTDALHQAEKDIEKEVHRYFETSKAEEVIRKELEKVGDAGVKKIGGRLEEVVQVLEDNEIIVGKLVMDDDEETKKTD